jgi:hypothetical protein
MGNFETDFDAKRSIRAKTSDRGWLQFLTARPQSQNDRQTGQPDVLADTRFEVTGEGPRE